MNPYEHLEAMIRAMNDDDARLARAVFVVADNGDDDMVVSLVHQFYADVDRANRTPRDMVYFHIGLLTGIAKRRIDGDESERGGLNQ